MYTEEVGVHNSWNKIMQACIHKASMFMIPATKKGEHTHNNVMYIIPETKYVTIHRRSWCI